MGKKGSISLSVNAIVVIILAIVLLGLGLGFVKGTFSKVSTNFEEQIAREAEPPTPTSDMPITLSRENIKTDEGNVEIIKISVLNPTGSDWAQRDFLYHGLTYPYVCGESDYVCYVNLAEGCDGSLDPDCIGIENKQECKKDGICLVNNYECPEYEDVTDVSSTWHDKFDVVVNGEFGPDEGHSQDCGPHDGIDILIRCDNKLMINKLTNPKVIKAGEVESFTTVLDINKRSKGSHLCKLIVFENDAKGNLIENFQKDLVIEVE